MKLRIEKLTVRSHKHLGFSGEEMMKLKEEVMFPRSEIRYTAEVYIEKYGGGIKTTQVVI